MAENGSRSTQTPSSPQRSLPFSSAVPPPRPPGPHLQPPRVHRPRLPIATPPPPTTVTLQPLGSSPAPVLVLPLSAGGGLRRPPVLAAYPPPPPSPTETVTLAAPRPDNDRVVNEYVETPFRPPDPPAAGHKSKATAKSADLVRGVDGRLSGTSTASVDRTRSVVVGVQRRRSDPHHQTINLPIVLHHNNNKGSSKRAGGTGVVTKQPEAAATFKKDLPPASGSGAGGGRGTDPTGGGGSATNNADCFRGSIICPECGRCRCESCRQPRPLPSRWLCNDACFCSSETAVDYASCLCCVKGVFYHCSKDYELDRDGSGSCADTPCSCGSHRFYTRWGCLGVLALALPCLLCYWPLKACVGLCEQCYARYANQGCRCEPRDPKITDLTPEKRLLDANPDF